MSDPNYQPPVPNQNPQQPEWAQAPEQNASPVYPEQQAPQPYQPPVAPPVPPQQYAPPVPPQPPVALSSQNPAYGQVGAPYNQHQPNQAPYGAPAYSHPQQYAPRPAGPNNGLAITSLITGIIPIALWFFAWFPFLTLIMGPLILGSSITAIITGHMALKQIKAAPQPGKGMALTGLILGYIAVGFLAIAVIIILLAMAAFAPYLDVYI